MANRRLWTLLSSAFTDEDAARAWAANEMTWGLFHVPERDVRVLRDVAGLDVIELGCGTRIFPPGWPDAALDQSVLTSPPPNHTAARCQQRFGPVFPLIEADAQNVPMRSASFDLVLGEYGGLWGARSQAGAADQRRS